MTRRHPSDRIVPPRLRTRRSLRLALLPLLIGGSFLYPALRLVVANDGPCDLQGRDESSIAAAIQKVSAAGGGTVALADGVWEIRDSILVGPAVRSLNIEGSGRTTLRLAPQVHAVTTEEAKSNDSVLRVGDASAFRPGAFIEVHAPGKVDAFSGKRPDFFAVKTIDSTRGEIRLARPLDCAIPANTTLLVVVNIFQVDRASNVAFRRLALDGGAKKGDIPPRLHTYHCGLFAGGPYSYTSGPTGSPATEISVLDCTLRDFWHRGVAFYSVERSRVADCRIERVGDEAIDFDHFTFRSAALSNLVLDSPVGIELNDAAHCLVEGNTVRGCAIGINLWRWCRMDWVDVENRVLGNTVERSATFGIRVAKGADRNEIAGNRIAPGAGPAIFIGGDRNRVIANTVEPAGASIQIEGLSNVADKAALVQNPPGAGHPSPGLCWFRGEKAPAPLDAVSGACLVAKGPLRIQGETHEAWSCHPPWKNGRKGNLLFSFPIPEGARRLSFHAAKQVAKGDGVLLRVYLAPSEGSIPETLQTYSSKIQDAAWTRHEVPLPVPPRAARVFIVIDPGPSNDTTFDETFLGDIRFE